MATDPRDYATTDHRQPPPSDTQSSSTAAGSSRFPDRYHPPLRSSTVATPDDYDRPRSSRRDDYYSAHSRSEDLNHSTTSSKASDQSPFLPSTSAPSLSSSTRLANTTSNSVASTNSQRRNSTSSYRSVASDTSDPTSGGQHPSTTHTGASTVPSTCSACGKPMQGAFVRALGAVFHLNCFKCMDCGDVVASKFFPIEGPDGKQHPLCERDYFRRLNLICAKCGMALRGSYITACNKKYHVEHFTCSICTTLFGPHDSYYEHDGDVYCHYHYSTRFATKCAGCSTAILKQFVEINRNMRDECWHPECYMINKFWNVKVVSRRPTSGTIQEPNAEPPYVEEEQRETAVSLKEKQIRMEQQVYRIWTVLSAFEESSAACISDMLRQVSNGQYLDAIRMAEKFILHVEVLFGAIDDLEHHFASNGLKGMSHVREARMLCRKTVDLFTLLSHTQETGARRMGMTQELLALVTGLAHYLKILIRIALTGALKLERDYDAHEPMTSFLDKLHMLAIQGANPSAKRLIKGSNGETLASSRSPNISTEGVTYGFRSLAPEYAGESPFMAAPRDPSLATVPTINPPSDLCVKCNQTVEEDCVRLGTYQRWHSNCIQCGTCGKVAAVLLPKDTTSPRQDDKDKDKERDKDKEGSSSKPTTQRRPPANVGFFVYDADSMKDSSAFGPVPNVICCVDHGYNSCRGGFQSVSRLEQYSFLLNVALRRLYTLLKKRGVVPASPVESPISASNGQDPYRNSGDINRLKSVHLDRKLSATAHVPKRSTVVESPAGKTAQTSDTQHQQRSQQPSFTPRPTQIQASTSQSQQATIQQPRPTGRPTMQSSPVPSQGPLPQFVQQQQQGQPSPQRPPRPTLSAEMSFDAQGFKPPYARGNSEVKIVEDSAPSSPSLAYDEYPPDLRPQSADDGITLADIPQLVQAAQARAQHRSLPGQSAIPFISELSALELAIVKHSAAVILTKSSLKDQMDMDEIFELLEMKKGGFWNRLFKPSGSGKKDVKKKGVFGVPLELLVEREGADSLHGASRTPLRVPSFIDDVVSAMRQMDMSVEGIFRKNGNIRRLKDLTDAIDRDPSSVDLTQDNAVQLAALLKKFLRELPEPLLTFKLHRLLVASQSMPTDEERQRILHMVSLLLPKFHRDTMEVLFVFLKWVASFAHMDEVTGSKMDLPNLATVICPSILYSRGRDVMRDESFGSIRVVTQLLENQDVYYCVPEEFLSIIRDKEQFASSMELPSKDFMKKCENYLRSRANGRPAMPMSPVSGGGFSNSNSVGNLQRLGEGQGNGRPMLGNSPPTESYIQRNGRQQSPQPQQRLQHSPYPQGPPNGHPSISQNVASIQQPQPRPMSTMQQPRDFDTEYAQPRPAPIPGQNPRSSSRPNSYAHPREDRESPHHQGSGTPRL